MTGIFAGRNRSALIASAVACAFLFAIVLLVVVVPFTPLYDPYGQNIMDGLLPPWSSGMMDGFHPLGTDALGRDLLSRLSLAGRVSLLIAFGAVTVSLLLGATLGLVAGYFGGAVEAIVMGVADIQLAIPKVLLLIAVTALLGPSLVQFTVILGLSSWVVYGRVARAMALTLREQEFVLAAITQGASAAWNIRKHLVPNVVAQMLILGSYELAQIILLEASLSYLGLGIQPPLPSWGLMIAEGQAYLADNPELSLLPGIAIFMLVMAVQVLSQDMTSEGEVDPASARS